MPTSTAADALTQYQWEPQPEAQALVNRLLARARAACPQIENLAGRMLDETATRFQDWVDFIEVEDDAGIRDDLDRVGFEAAERPGAEQAFHHPGGIFPMMLLRRGGGADRVGLKVDSVADFLHAWPVMLDPAATGRSAEVDATIEGGPGTTLRMARAFAGGGWELWAVERHGDRGFETRATQPAFAAAWLRHAEAIYNRRRDFEDAADGFAHAMDLVDAAIGDLGRDAACDLFFEGERRYWMRRNTAARVQYARQCRLGLGWANHDHHTYRSSREQFPRLVALLEKLGFYCRERFYAGAEAGWGAQVLEQDETGIVIFADVDMSPEEVTGDFAHAGFAPREGDELGTVGLWVALHGEAAMQAGMHHLECMFDHHALVEQLQGESGIATMDPFTTFPYLRQAFTEGERWIVPSHRLKPLLDRGTISREQAELFATKGAVGSHLENLERNDGYKGFNQTGVSDIIARTDARKLAATS
ncbi:MAG: hypothetical protein AAFX79_06125 [Planctomycetota bacterium]